MPRYYFEIHAGGRILTDEFGLELADPGEAREQAIAILPDIIRGKAPTRDQHMVECLVKTADGSVIYSGRLIFNEVRNGKACSAEV